MLCVPCAYLWFVKYSSFTKKSIQPSNLFHCLPFSHVSTSFLLYMCTALYRYNYPFFEKGGNFVLSFFTSFVVISKSWKVKAHKRINVLSICAHLMYHRKASCFTYETNQGFMLQFTKASQSQSTWNNSKKWKKNASRGGWCPFR